MKKLILLLISLTFISFQIFAQASNCDINTGMNDVTATLDSLGNIPQSKGMQTNERNIWDLQNFQNRIYIGYGNTATNAGPVSLWSIDVNKTLANEGIFSTEAFERFRVYNNTLMVPNSDPKGFNSNVLKVATKSALGTWTEHNWGPTLAHSRDILFFDNEYYILGNGWRPASKDADSLGIHVTSTNFSNVSTTLIESELNAAGLLRNARWNWFFGGFTFKDTLVMPNAMLTMAYIPGLTIEHSTAFIKTTNTIEWTANMPPNTQIRHNNLYPVDTTVTTPIMPDYIICARPFESVEYNNKLLVSYRTYALDTTNYHLAYNNSAGMICKTHLKDEAEFITFPDPNAVGEDMLIQNADLYVLANKKINANSYIVYVYKTTNPSLQPGAWTEVLRFSSTNRARSFEFLNGFLHFGLGNNYDEPTNHSGELLRVKVNCSNINCSTGGLPCDDGNICTSNDIYDNNCNCYGIVMDSDGDGVCDPLDCISYLFVDNTLLTTNSIFTAQNILESNASIDNNNPFQVHYTAQNHIELQPGFETGQSSIFIAEIKPCN